MTDGRVLSEEEIRAIETALIPSVERLRMGMESSGVVNAKTAIPNLIVTIRDLQRQVAELTDKVTAPDGFDTDIRFYCKECGEEAIRCEGCRKWICGDCNEKHGGQQWFCVDCDEHEPRQEATK
ncbi:hypothetical protein ACOALA_04010 [Alicyclobacillus acidoterrestris]|uniref:hypothetical protein n=1 Tax=Alicyclobacillus acidoterrestris TaxID=1450 RepID=UPI003F5294F0